MAEAAKKQEREAPMVPPNRCQMAEHGRNIFLITAETGEFPGDFLQPEFYAHVAKDMRPMDHVEIRTDDGTYWAELLVTEAAANWAKVHLLREAKLQPAGDQPTDKRFRIEWKGPHLKHCVIRAKDSSVIHSGDALRKDSMTWLEDYTRNIGKG